MNNFVNKSQKISVDGKPPPGVKPCASAAVWWEPDGIDLWQEIKNAHFARWPAKAEPVLASQFLPLGFLPPSNFFCCPVVCPWTVQNQGPTLSRCWVGLCKRIRQAESRRKRHLKKTREGSPLQILLSRTRRSGGRGVCRETDYVRRTNTRRS